MYTVQLLIIILVFAVLIGTSQVMIENFIFDIPMSDKVSINPELLLFSVPLPDSKDKKEMIDVLIEKIVGTQQTMYNNMIKYGADVIKWSKWIYNNTEDTSIDSIGRQVCQYINKKEKVIFYKLNKYRYDKDTYNMVLLDIELVLFKEKNPYAKHIQTVCVVELMSQKIHVIDIRLLGIISEDKIYAVTNHASSNHYMDIDNLQQNTIDENMYSLLYEDNCKSMMTQDAQLHSVLYSQLMHIDDEASLQNQQYIENQNIVRNMFMQNIEKRHKTCRRKRLGDSYKHYPYKEDFSIVS